MIYVHKDTKYYEKCINYTKENNNISIVSIFYIFPDSTINIKKAIIFSKYNLYL